MRIGFDGACLGNRRGFGRFTGNLLHALGEVQCDHEFVVFLDEWTSSRVELPTRFTRRVVPLRESPAQAASAGGNRKVRDLIAMGRAVAAEQLDAMFFPASYSYFPVWNVQRVVVTIHDTLPLSHPELVFPTKRGRWFWRLKEWYATRSADLILTVSEASRRDLIAWHRLKGTRVRVIPEGAAQVFESPPDLERAARVLRAWGIEPNQRYLLYVGGLSPHKNLLRLLKAFARFAPTEFVLVLVGDFTDVFHTHVPEIRAAIEEHRLEGRVRLTGYVPDDDLVYLYHEAFALVLPSILEGFGLPAVEAMSQGCPVVASLAGSLPEIVGDAGVFFDPLSVDGLGGAMRLLIEHPNLRSALVARARPRASLFTWKNAARDLIDALEGCEPQPARGGFSQAS